MGRRRNEGHLDLQLGRLLIAIEMMGDTYNYIACLLLVIIAMPRSKVSYKLSLTKSYSCRMRNEYCEVQ